MFRPSYWKLQAIEDASSNRERVKDLHDAMAWEFVDAVTEDLLEQYSEDLLDRADYEAMAKDLETLEAEVSVKEGEYWEAVERADAMEFVLENLQDELATAYAAIEKLEDKIDALERELEGDTP